MASHNRNGQTDGEVSSLEHHNNARRTQVASASSARRITPAGSASTRSTRKDSPWSDEVVKCYVKNSLFPRRKFIEKESALEFSTKKNSICNQFLVFCNLHEEEKELQLQCWNESKEKIRAGLNEKRNAICWNK